MIIIFSPSISLQKSLKRILLRCNSASLKWQFCFLWKTSIKCILCKSFQFYSNSLPLNCDHFILQFGGRMFPWLGKADWWLQRMMKTEIINICFSLLFRWLKLGAQCLLMHWFKGSTDDPMSNPFLQLLQG